MLREEQIDLRRQRARAANLLIENLGKNRVFSDYRVTNPQTKGQYTVTVRGFDTGDNACTCPDFKSNTLGTCKHIEAVLDKLQADGEPVKRRKATVTRPEVVLDYSAAQLRLRLQLPPRHSDPNSRRSSSTIPGYGTASTIMPNSWRRSSPCRNK
jgi:hypothetical protein